MYVSAGLLYKTTNGGNTWIPLFSEQPITSVAIDHNNPVHLLIGRSDGQVWFSDDGGTTWGNISSNLPGYWIKVVAFGGSNELWVGTGINGGVGNGYLYHSINSGVSWDAVNLGQASISEIHTIFVDLQNHNIVYVGLRSIYNEMFNPAEDVYLVKTSDDGLHWNPLRLPFTDAMINVIGRAPYDTMLYVGSGGRVFSSSDGGQSWTAISPTGSSGDIYDIAVDPRNTNVIYLPRRAYGIVKSTDRGASWTPMNEGLLNTTVSLIALSDPSGSTLYATSSGGEGTYKSTNYGNTWINLTANGITHPFADELAVSPTDPQTIWDVADVGEVFCLS